jgi:mannitol-specific phosphotransferase system IIBC component
VGRYKVGFWSLQLWLLYLFLRQIHGGLGFPALFFGDGRAGGMPRGCNTWSFLAGLEDVYFPLCVLVSDLEMVCVLLSIGIVY